MFVVGGRLVRGRVGRALIAIRDNPTAAMTYRRAPRCIHYDCRTGTHDQCSEVQLSKPAEEARLNPAEIRSLGSKCREWRFSERVQSKMSSDAAHARLCSAL
jgi:hypothetical protein